MDKNRENAIRIMSQGFVIVFCIAFGALLIISEEPIMSAIAAGFKTIGASIA